MAHGGGFLRGVWVVLFISGIAAASVTFDMDTLVQDGDYYDYVDVDPWPNSVITVDMTGGRIDDLSTWMSSITNISGGSVGNIYTYESSTVNITAPAVIDRLETYSDSASVFSMVHLRAGSLSMLDCYGFSEVHVYGQDFAYDPYYDVNTGLLSGLWADNTAFSIYLWNAPQTWDNVYLHEIPALNMVPAPSAMVLVAIGTALVVRLSGKNRI